LRTRKNIQRGACTLAVDNTAFPGFRMLQKNAYIHFNPALSSMQKRLDRETTRRFGERSGRSRGSVATTRKTLTRVKIRLHDLPPFLSSSQRVESEHDLIRSGMVVQRDGARSPK
jgi:hypothetical protein